MMFRFPSVICTRCTGFFCLAIIKGPPNDIYCIIEEPYKHYFTEKVSYSQTCRSRKRIVYLVATPPSPCRINNASTGYQIPHRRYLLKYFVF